MINIEELRADIEAGTPGDWQFRESGFRADVLNEVGMTVAESWPHDARRITRLPQLEREYLAMRGALDDANAVHVNLLAGKIARPTVAQIIHIYGEEALRLAMKGETQ